MIEILFYHFFFFHGRVQSKMCLNNREEHFLVKAVPISMLLDKKRLKFQQVIIIIGFCRQKAYVRLL